MAPSLRYSLHGQSSYVLGKPILITFDLENSSSTDLWVLTWYTPLEGIQGKILEVTCDGEAIPYEGMMVKRGNPGKEDYVLIHAGGSAHAEFDLSQAYSLRECKECRLSFKGRIRDVVVDGQHVPQAAEQQVSVQAPGEPLSFRIEKGP